MDPFRGNGPKQCIFLFLQIQNLQLKQVPYNKLLTNLACSSRTGEYWSSVILPRPQANIHQYGLRPRLVRSNYKIN